MGQRQEARWKVRFRPLWDQGIFMGCWRAGEEGGGGRDCRAGGMRRALGFPVVPGWGIGACGKRPSAPTSGRVRSPLGGNRSLEAESPQLFPSTLAGRGGQMEVGRSLGREAGVEFAVLPG